MARIVLVHGAFNELWGPHELKSRWLPAVCGTGCGTTACEIADDDVAVCFYGDLFRRVPGTEEDAKLEQSRAGIAESLARVGRRRRGRRARPGRQRRRVRPHRRHGHRSWRPTPTCGTEMRARIEPLVDDDTRVIVAHSLGTVLSYMALATIRSGRCTPSSRSDRRWRHRWSRHARSGAGRRKGAVAGLDRAVGERAGGRRQGGGGAGGGALRRPGRGRAWSTTATGPTRPSRTSTPRPPAAPSPPPSGVPTPQPE